MGANCCQSNEVEVKNEVNLKNVEPKKMDTKTAPAVMGTNEDAKLRQEVEDIWTKYDTNNNGVLDQKEAYAFLDDMMREVTGQAPT